MTTVLEIAQATVERASKSYYRLNDNGTGRMQSYCQQFVGDFLTAAGIRYSGSYPSADAARADSVIYTSDWRQASPGDIVYLSPNHVGIYAGGGLMISATGWSTKAVRSLGKAVYVHRVDDYAAHLKLVGFSRTNGKRPQVTGLSGIALAGDGGLEKIGMELTDKVGELPVDNWAAGPGADRYTLKDRFVWIAWFGKRTQMILDGQITSELFKRIEATLARIEAAVGKVTVPEPPKVDPAALVAALKDPSVTAAIAKAVNDDAARRLQE